METLQDLVQRHLAETGASARSLAERLGMSYPTLLSIVNKGSLPRKQEHREGLRQLLGVNEYDWSIVLLASAGLEIDEADLEPPTFQVLVARHMYSAGMTEQSLSKAAKVPYPTVVGVVRKGIIPRVNALEQLRRALGLDEAEVEAAVGNSRDRRRISERHTLDLVSGEEGLATIVAGRIRDAGQTIAQFARDNQLGYLSLSRFLASGEPPADATARETLRQAVGLSRVVFERALDLDESAPHPATVTTRAGEPPPEATPLQVALLRFMRDHNLTIKSLSQRSGLSQITVSRLVKQGSPPSRARTHQQLQELLGLTEAEYLELIKPSGEVPLPTPVHADAGDEDEFAPTTAIEARIDLEGDQELRELLAQVTVEQRDELLDLLRSLVDD